MLRKRVIPIVLLDGFSVLKTIKFSVRRNLGSPITVMRTYNTRNVDELVLLDIDASKQGRSVDKFIIKELAEDCFMPLTVGGGVRCKDDVRQLLESGADKVSINKAALDNPSLISEFADVFGSQCIVISIDVVYSEGEYKIFSGGEHYIEMTPLEWAVKAESLGAGELLVNNVSRDGVMEGADLDLVDSISSVVSIPVIFAGGVASPENSAEVVRAGASAVGVSSIFHFTDFTPNDCRDAIRKAGFPAR